MAKQFWEDDAPAASSEGASTASEGGNFWEGDADAAKADLPEGVKPSTAGGGRGSVNPDTVAEAEERAAAERPAFNVRGARRRDTPPKKETRSLLERAVEDAAPGTVSDAELRGLAAQERREAWEDQNRPARPELRGADRPRSTAGDIMAGRGWVWGQDTGALGRVAGKTAAGIAQGIGGTVRAVGDVLGAEGLQNVGRATAEGAEAFERGVDASRPAGGVEGFGPRSPVPYLQEMGEGAASSLAQSVAVAAGGGPKAVIGTLSMLQAGQSYNEARNAGLDPAEALARAIPQGAFEALGDKFAGYDRVVGALRSLMSRQVSAQTKRSAADELKRMGVREIPGEVATYLGQTGVDLIPGIGLNPNMTVAQFLDGLRDTVVQSTMMGNAAGLGGATLGRQANEQLAAQGPTAEQMARSRGFLTPEAPRAAQPGAAPQAPTPAENAPSGPNPAAPAPVPTPEPLADVAAQIEAIRDPSSAKTAALITPKTPAEGLDMRGLHVVPTHLGTFVTSDPDVAREVAAQRETITDDQMGQLLGYTTPKGATDGTVVQAVDGQGNVTHEEVTNADTVPLAAQQATLMAPEGGGVVVTNALAAQQRREAEKTGPLARAAAAVHGAEPVLTMQGLTDPKARPKGIMEQAQSQRAIERIEAEESAKADFEAAMLADKEVMSAEDATRDMLEVENAPAETKPAKTETKGPKRETPHPSPAPRAPKEQPAPPPAASDRTAADGRRAAPKADAGRAGNPEDAPAAPTDRGQPRAAERAGDVGAPTREGDDAARADGEPGRGRGVRLRDAPDGEGRRAGGAAGQAEGRPGGDGVPAAATYDSVEAAAEFIKAQRRRGANISAVPVVGDDGRVRIATSGTPDYAKGVEQREQRRQAERRAEAGIRDGDITKPDGEPFKSKVAAVNAAKKAGDADAMGDEVLFSPGGRADLAQRQPAAGWSRPEVKTSPASAAHERKAERVLERMRGQQEAFMSFQAVEPAQDGPQGRHLAAVRTVAKRVFGRDVVFVKFNGPAVFNGVQSKLYPDTVFINVESSRPYMAVLGHELLHSLRQQNPNIYRDMVRQLANVLNDRTSEFYEDMKAKYEAIGREMPTDWTEELYADVVGDHFLDPAFWQALAADQSALGRRVVNAVLRFLDGLITKLAGLTGFDSSRFISDARAARRIVAHSMSQFARESRTQTGLTDARGESLSATPDQTKTPEFRRWFGDSKVVDAEGKPLVVYHGTAADISVFDISRSGESTNNTGFFGRGAYFTEDIEDAAGYAAWAERGDGGRNLIPAYLSIQNPVYVHVNPKTEADRARSRQSLQILLDQLEKNGVFGTYPDPNEAGSLFGKLTKLLASAEFERFMGTLYNSQGGGQAVTALAQKAGFDGVLVEGFKRDRNMLLEAVAFRPEQIKSAIGNAGTFDPSNPDIRMSAADAPPPPKKPNPALVKAIFEGSMNYTRDQNGKPVKLAEQKERYKAIDTDERGQMLLRKGYVTADQLKRWKASPLDVYDGAVNNRFARHFETPGVVWKDAELRERFGLDDEAIAAYREMRAAADTSLARNAVADMLRLADADGAAVRDQVMAEPMEVGAITLRDHLLAEADNAEDKAKRRQLIDKANRVIDILDDASAKMEAGFVPDDLKRDASPAAWESAPLTRLDRVIYELQDGRVDLKRTQEAIERAGNKIREDFDARLAETLMAGRVAKRTQDFLKREVEPLLALMARNRITQDEFGDYLHARAAPERNEQIAKVNPDMPDGGAGSNSKGLLLTTAAAKKYIADLPAERREVLEKLAQRVDAITKGTRQLLVSEGLEDADTIKAWEKVYKRYVPMFREDVEFNRIVTSKRATGSERKAVNILANVLLQREAAISRAESNRVKVALYGLALTNPNPDYWVTIRPDSAIEDIAADLKRMGVDPVMAEPGMAPPPTVRSVDPVTNKVVDRVNPFYANLPTAITLKVNGESRVLLLNQNDERAVRMAAALKGSDKLTQIDIAGSIVGRMTRWMAAVNTQFNPVFGIVNFWRDTQAGIIHLGNTELRGKYAKVFGGLPGALRGIAAHIAGTKDPGKWSQLFEQFQQDGGQTGFREMFADGSARAAALERELARMQRGRADPRRAAGAVFKFLAGFNDVMENAVRLSAYAAALDQGMSRPQAARLARELTVDFNRKGRATRELGPLYAFFNASLQGSERTIRALRGPTGKAIIAGGLSLGVLQALLLAAAGFDDDEIPEYVKARALVIPLFDKEKRYITIPLALGLHVLPNTGRALTELAIGDRKNFGKKVFDTVGEIGGAFNPLGGGNIFTADGALRTLAPTVVDPFIELGMNRNFAGTPIERDPRGETDVRPGFQRARESTQRRLTGQAYLGVSKALNTMTGGSDYQAGLVSPTPERLRYLSQVALGGVLRETEKLVDMSNALARGQELPSNSIPLASRFAGKVDPDRVETSRYYENLRDVEKVKGALSAAKKAGDADAMERIVTREPLAEYIKTSDRIQRKVRELNKLAVEVIGDPERQKEVDDVRVETMKALNDAIRDAERARRGPTVADRLRVTP